MSKLVSISSIFVGLLYNIWPLGFWMDPGVIQNSYISVLEYPGRPYAWFFIAADIVTGTIVFLIGCWLYSHLKHRTSSISYMIAGLANLSGAILPIDGRCSATIRACGIAPSQVLSSHDIASMIEAFALLVGLYSLYKVLKNQQSTYITAGLVFVAWSLSGIFLVVSIATSRFTLASQASFLGMSGISLIAIPHLAMKYYQNHQPYLINRGFKDKDS